MKKLFTILSIVLLSGLFYACEEEEITPQAENKTLRNAQEDPGQWD